MVTDNIPNKIAKSETKPAAATCMMGTCSSVHLAEKLKKLMETPMSLEGNPMECEPAQKENPCSS